MMAPQAMQTPSQKELQDFNPNDLVDRTGQLPFFHFEWKEPGKKKGEKVPPQRKKKRRQLSIPNRAMIALHKLFRVHLEVAIAQMGDESASSDNYPLRRIPSATGCVPGSNHFKNSLAHKGKRFYYVTDLKSAYPSVDLHRLTILLVFIFKYRTYKDEYGIRYFGRNELAHFAMETDLAFAQWESFVKMAFGGLGGHGLAVGGPLSPYLLNLYCEVFLDSRVRQYCEKREDRQHPEKTILYTRYVDDLVWSSDTIISSERRREFRRMISEAGFTVNHRKSQVLDRENGIVFITKVGLDERKNGTSLVFPDRKRQRLEGIIKSFLCEPFQKDNPEVIAGLAAEFLHYYSLSYPVESIKRPEPTRSDKRTFGLCKEFEKAALPNLERLRYARERKQHEKGEQIHREKKLRNILKARKARTGR
jgi:hypothetical protein